MTRQLTKENFIITFIITTFFMLTIVACSSSDLATELSGQWKRDQGSGTVDINLTKDSSSLTIDGKTFQGAVDKIDKGSNTVYVKVATDGGSTEMWELHQVWNDNGSAFKLKLRRNGATEILTPVGNS
jgi:hypothetical protein